MSRVSTFEFLVSTAKRALHFEFRISSAAIRLLLAAAALSGLLALPSPRVSTQASAAQTPKPRPPQTDPQALLGDADELLREMSHTTGLPIKAPLKKQTLSRPELEKYLVENLRAENTPAELHAQEATLRAFGLVSREFNLEKFLISFYSEQAAGFYDPRRKTMFMADWLTPEMQSMVLAHELTHALQDQNFDLEKFLRAVKNDDDATNARQAVAEGHAMAAMLQHQIQPLELTTLPSLEPFMAAMVRQRMEEFPTFSNAPYFFRLQSLFPYSEGMGFMQRGLAQGGWKELSSLFSNPPKTTKEIFEPESYFDRKPLPAISLPRPAPLAEVPGLRVTTENTMGELGYRALVGQFISDEESKSLTTAWLGDRYIIYETAATQQYVLVARTRWSSPEKALAFFRDYHAILARKYPELAPDRRSGSDLFIGSTASGEIILLRKGDEVSWGESIPTSQTDAMLAWLRSR